MNPPETASSSTSLLEWSGAWENELCWLAHEPGKEHPTTKIKGDGWLQFKTPRWTFITRQIDGRFPNWKQVVPAESANGTNIRLSDAVLKQMLQIIPRLPGDEAPNHPVRLRITSDQFLLEGQRQSEWTSIPTDDWKVTGQPVTVAVNRHYLMAALRLELNHLHIIDSLTPIVFTRGGKRVLVMPVNLEGPKRTSVTQPQNQLNPTKLK